jgi:hypothetical protein
VRCAAAWMVACFCFCFCSTAALILQEHHGTVMNRRMGVARETEWGRFLTGMQGLCARGVGELTMGGVTTGGADKGLHTCNTPNVIQQ